MIDFNPLVAAIAAAVVQHLQASGLVVAAQPAVPSSYPPPQPAPHPQYQAPPQAAPQAPLPQNTYAPPGTMPAQPFQQPPAAAPQGQYPFADNIGAQNWTTDAWNKAVAVNQDQAQVEFGALMAQLGTADFNHIGPDKFPILYNGVMAIKAKMGIQG